MLLRSITKHVKDQNWFAVFLDFFIVVAGILIAFQITNWNEARSDTAREKVLLERLAVDLNRTLEFVEIRGPAIAAQPAATSQVIEMLRANTPPTDQQVLFDLVKQSVDVWAQFELSPTYSEMVATGSLSEISNKTLSSVLTQYRRSQNNSALMIDIQLEARDNLDLHRAVKFTTHATDGNATTKPVSVDWELLRYTEPQLQIILRNQLLRKVWHETAVSEIHQALEIIDAELGTAPKNGADISASKFK